MAQENLSGPHLHIAAFCEKVLSEGSVVSLIRVIDRFIVSGPTAEMLPAPLSFFLVISFKAGFVRGKHIIKVVPIAPSGQELPGIEIPQLFEGDDDRGVMVAAQLNFWAQEEGTYWFNLYFEAALMTRMPLRIVYQQQGTSAGPAVG